MNTFLGVGVVILGFVLSIIARPHEFEDDGVELSVPRSPKIQGPSEISLTYYPNGTQLDNLNCEIKGLPTPTVIWTKDEKEIFGDSDSYNITYDVTDGKAQLAFTPTAYKTEGDADLIGNFTCIAANFLGRAQKSFRIQKHNSTTVVSPSDSTTESGKVLAGNSKEMNTTDASRLLKILGQ